MLSLPQQPDWNVALTLKKVIEYFYLKLALYSEKCDKDWTHTQSIDLSYYKYWWK